MTTIYAVSRRKALLLLSSAAIALMASPPLRAQEEESQLTLCRTEVMKDVEELGRLIQGLSMDPDTPDEDIQPLESSEVSRIYADVHARLVKKYSSGWFCKKG